MLTADHGRHALYDHCTGCGGAWPCRPVLLRELEAATASVVDSALLTAEAVRRRIELEALLTEAMNALAQAEGELAVARYGWPR